MKKRNHFKKFLVLSSVLVLALTALISTNTKTESKAAEWFGSGKISVKKCAITLKKDSYNWTGSEIRPEVRVNYKGTDLEKNVDYIVSYKDNVDAGEGIVVIEGKGDYKGKAKVKFQINGIDFKKECIATVNNGKVEVYYKGKLLINEIDYYYTHMSQELLQKSEPAGDGYLNTYKVTDYYTIIGQEKFEGSIVKQIVTEKVKYEDGCEVDFDWERD